MNWFPKVYGNAAAKMRLGKAIEENRLSHAFILEGAEGSGKRTFALQIAAALSCTGKGDTLPCGECDFCRKVLSGNATDVHILDKGEETTVKIDAVREMKSDMILSSNESPYKVYIIDDADTMTVQAQNACLIALEEPPPDVVIILLCTTSDALLPTIRSRAPIFRMSLFSDDDLRNYVVSVSNAAALLQKNDCNKFLALTESANGVIGVALAAMEPTTAEKILKQRKTVDNIVDAVRCKKNFYGMYSVIADLPTKRNELSDYLSLLMTALVDLLLLKKDPYACLSYYYDRDVAIELSSCIGTGKLLSLCDTVDKANFDLDKNANVNALLTELAGKLKS